MQHIQRAASAVDLSNLLRPDSDSPPRPYSTPHSPNLAPQEVPREGSAMTAAVSSLQPAAMGGIQAGERSADLPRPYKCPLCDKAFHRLEHQTRHIRTHTGEKPHACHFPGCSKKFSRSDELTRHSRIHNNPNSRRNNKAMSNIHPSQTAAVVSYAQEQAMLQLPSRSIISQSAPVSQTGSPNVSPPHSYAAVYPPNPVLHQQRSPGGSPPNMLPRNPLDINLLATAADQVERDSSHLGVNGPTPARHNGFQQTHFNTYQPHSRPYPSSLSAYAFSHSSNSTANNSPSLSRSHSPARPSLTSPQSTAPSSPAFSHDSYSPTPEATPLATPGHSPRLRPYHLPQSALHSSGSSTSISNLIDSPGIGSPNGIQLPGLRHLSLGSTIPVPSSLSSSPAHGVSAQPPPLAPMEPTTETMTSAFMSPHGSSNNSPYGSYQPPTSLAQGSRLSDIMRSSDGSQRKLPVPKVAVGDMLSHGDPMEQR